MTLGNTFWSSILLHFIIVSNLIHFQLNGGSPKKISKTIEGSLLTVLRFIIPFWIHHKGHLYGVKIERTPFDATVLNNEILFFKKKLWCIWWERKSSVVLVNDTFWHPLLLLSIIHQNILRHGMTNVILIIYLSLSQHTLNSPTPADAEQYLFIYVSQLFHVIAKKNLPRVRNMLNRVKSSQPPFEMKILDRESETFYEGYNCLWILNHVLILLLWEISLRISDVRLLFLSLLFLIYAFVHVFLIIKAFFHLRNCIWLTI